MNKLLLTLLLSIVSAQTFAADCGSINVPAQDQSCIRSRVNTDLRKEALTIDARKTNAKPCNNGANECEETSRSFSNQTLDANVCVAVNFPTGPAATIAKGSGYLGFADRTDPLTNKTCPYGFFGAGFECTIWVPSDYPYLMKGPADFIKCGSYQRDGSVIVKNGSVSCDGVGTATNIYTGAVSPSTDNTNAYLVACKNPNSTGTFVGSHASTAFKSCKNPEARCTPADPKGALRNTRNYTYQVINGIRVYSQLNTNILLRSSTLNAGSTYDTLENKDTTNLSVPLLDTNDLSIGINLR